MRSFSDLHPWVQLSYYPLVLLITMLTEHPLLLLLHFMAATAIAWGSVGFFKLGKSLKMLLPMVLFAAILNPLVNHTGDTVLFSLFGEIPFTLEALCYGIFAGVRLGTMLLWFTSWNQVLTPDKLLRVFGKRFPALGLILTMGQRFVPLLLLRFRQAAEAQKVLHPDQNALRHAGGVLSIVVSRSLEGALTTADGMKSRGYGLPNRSCYRPWRFSPRDGVYLTAILCVGSLLLIGLLSGSLAWEYYPRMGGTVSALDPWLLVGAAVLELLPLMLEGGAWLRWRALNSKT